MMATATTETIRGRVAAKNDRGLQLWGEKEWRNYSAYAKGLPTVDVGAVVDLTLDARDFVRSVVIIDTHSSHGHELREARSPDVTELPSKDVQIIRESALKSAAQFCAARPELKSSDLFCLAEKMEAWVLR